MKLKMLARMAEDDAINIVTILKQYNKIKKLFVKPLLWFLFMFFFIYYTLCIITKKELVDTKIKPEDLQ